MPKTNYSASAHIPVIATVECDGRAIEIVSAVHATWKDAQRAVARRTRPTYNPTTPIAATQRDILEANALSA